MRNLTILATGALALSSCLHQATNTPLVKCVPELSATSAPQHPMLSIQFAEALQIRPSREGRLCSEQGADLSGLGNALSHVGVVTFSPVFSNREAIERLADEIRARGEKPLDLLSWHHLQLSPSADIGAAIEALRARAEVVYVEKVSEVIPPPP